MIDCLLVGRRADGSTVHIAPPPPKPAWTSPPVGWRLDLGSDHFAFSFAVGAGMVQLDCGASTALLALVVRQGQGLSNCLSLPTYCLHDIVLLCLARHDRRAAGQFAVEGRLKSSIAAPWPLQCQPCCVSTCNTLIRRDLRQTWTEFAGFSGAHGGRLEFVQLCVPLCLALLFLPLRYPERGSLGFVCGVDQLRSWQMPTVGTSDLKRYRHETETVHMDEIHGMHACAYQHMHGHGRHEHAWHSYMAFMTCMH